MTLLAVDQTTPYNRILKQQTHQQMKLSDKTRAGHNTRSMNPRNDRPLKIISDPLELQMHDNSD